MCIEGEEEKNLCAYFFWLNSTAICMNRMCVWMGVQRGKNKIMQLYWKSIFSIQFFDFQNWCTNAFECLLAYKTICVTFFFFSLLENDFYVLMRDSILLTLCCCCCCCIFRFSRKEIMYESTKWMKYFSNISGSTNHIYCVSSFVLWAKVFV